MSEELLLLIADREENRASLAGPLRREGYSVVDAASVGAAREALAGRPPEVALLDLSGGAALGVSVCHELTSLPELAETCVVFIAERGEKELEQRVSELGVDDFLVKPVGPTELLVRVRSLLRVKRSQRKLEQRATELLRLQHQKDELMALVVHEFRNPLAAVVTNAAYLIELGTLQGDEAQALQDIASAAESMNRMVMNLVDLQKSEDAGLPLRVEAIEPGRLTGDVANAMRRRASERAHRLTARVDGDVPVFHGDYELLRRVFENLVDNALRNTPRGGEVELVCKSAEQSVEFGVRDQGPGVPLEMRARVFDKYVELEPRPAGQARTSRGLGLAYCKAAVEAHGGKIVVESAEPSGALFKVTLPLSPPERADTQRKETKSS
jgi:two-component system sensor histidine kinase/response regulator